MSSYNKAIFLGWELYFLWNKQLDFYYSLITFQKPDYTAWANSQVNTIIPFPWNYTFILGTICSWNELKTRVNKSLISGQEIFRCAKKSRLMSTMILLGMIVHLRLIVPIVGHCFMNTIKDKQKTFMIFCCFLAALFAFVGNVLLACLIHYEKFVEAFLCEMFLC